MNISPVTFYILLALARGDMHGYAVVQQMEEDTRGHLFLKERSIYRALTRMMREGFIDESPGSDLEKRRYRLTSRGRRALQSEYVRMQDAITLLRSRIR